MHPPLHRPHPQCQAVVAALTECHESNPFAKYMGACNDAKVALDQCFRAEKEVKRKANADKARESRKRFEERVAAREAAEHGKNL
mmetsp:Transcript_20102/g.35730  ORF Transcript_20102/g.35730 Transcript_20102/m.35730 type:complete len:85 (-) Transcript_20102:294-548(-)|eukprot:CAMPEP_0184511690 /NCGR_PEP_ID=MMETSP0198_2-20121128/2485_1 /TAXON_ID=1112570 /ORGANISM="Thraustochytrium sp., Strain LLF1b" /LENGTH=84 /DNA_ID=CAMNT_0026901671 /DNA_START=136 /DNA_END=390 /DNA_ORIENTATION=+